MFLAHFLGDVHQPLHCGSVQDYGGNAIAVCGIWTSSRKP
jgi:hypothetical protein